MTKAERIEKIERKVCRKCEIEKTIDNFYFCKHKHYSWHTAYCKDCYRKRNTTKERKEYNNRWKTENGYGKTGLPRIKRNAKQRVLMAIKRGDLVRGLCEACETDKDIHGHHDNYNKPLEVRWLCGKHHRELHAKTISKNKEIIKIDYKEPKSS